MVHDKIQYSISLMVPSPGLQVLECKITSSTCYLCTSVPMYYINVYDYLRYFSLFNQIH